MPGTFDQQVIQNSEIHPRPKGPHGALQRRRQALSAVPACTSTAHAQDDELAAEAIAAAANSPDEMYLYIVTNSLQSACDVGLLASHGLAGAPQWEHAESLEEAVTFFQRYWDGRDKWLRALLAGEPDAASR